MRNLFLILIIKSLHLIWCENIILVLYINQLQCGKQKVCGRICALVHKLKSMRRHFGDGERGDDKVII